MSRNDDTTEWMTQARRGLLELCILTLVGQAAQYGYELLTVLARWPQLAVSEGTLYPLLRRLEKEGVISAQWRSRRRGRRANTMRSRPLAPSGEMRWRPSGAS